VKHDVGVRSLRAEAIDCDDYLPIAGTGSTWMTMSTYKARSPMLSTAQTFGSTLLVMVVAAA
jgi:hypothetical protein